MRQIFDRIRGALDRGGSGLRRAGRRSNATIQVSHVSRVDSYDRSKVDDMLRSFVDKHSRMSEIQSLSINIKKHKSTGSRSKYSMKGSVITDTRTFRATSVGWDVLEATHVILASFRKQMLKQSTRTSSVKRANKRRAKK